MLEVIREWRDKSWQWFSERAHGPHALGWLAAVSFLDPIFLPVAPEFYLVALMLARPELWRRYLPTTIGFSVLGAIAGYLVGGFLFHQFGLPVLQFYHLEGVFVHAQNLVRGHIFFGMILIAFSPIPEKVAVLAAGVLGVHFFPFILGFFVGRSVRLSLVVYLTQKYGERLIGFLQRYFRYFMILVVLIVAYYSIVHWRILLP